jgi:hypothetical protein
VVAIVAKARATARRGRGRAGTVGTPGKNARMVDAIMSAWTVVGGSRVCHVRIADARQIAWTAGAQASAYTGSASINAGTAGAPPSASITE